MVCATASMRKSDLPKMNDHLQYYTCICLLVNILYMYHIYIERESGLYIYIYTHTHIHTRILRVIDSVRIFRVIFRGDAHYSVTIHFGV